MVSHVHKADPKRQKFIEKLTTPDALKYWIRMIVEGYQRLYKNEGFTESPIIADSRKDTMN